MTGYEFRLLLGVETGVEVWRLLTGVAWPRRVLGRSRGDGDGRGCRYLRCGDHRG